MSDFRNVKDLNSARLEMLVCCVNKKAELIDSEVRDLLEVSGMVIFFCRSKRV